MGTERLTVPEAARYLGVTPRYLFAMVDRGALAMDGDRFTLAALKAHRDSQSRPGRRSIRYLTARCRGQCKWCVDPINPGDPIAILTDGETYVHDRHLTED